MLVDVYAMLVITLLGQAGTDDPPPRALPPDAPAPTQVDSDPKPDAAAKPESDPQPDAVEKRGFVPLPRYEFDSFGESKPLARAERIVVAKPTSVHELPIGTSVARCEVLETMLPIGEARPRAEVVVLGAHGEFRPGAEYVLFLARFRGGSRYVALARIAAGDRDFVAKRRVLKAFSEVERIPSENERAGRIRDLLLENLADRDSFVRWNAIAEMKSFARYAKDLPEVLSAEHRARLVKLLRDERSTAVREALTEILETLGVDLAAEPAPRENPKKDP